MIATLSGVDLSQKQVFSAHEPFTTGRIWTQQENLAIFGCAADEVWETRKCSGEAGILIFEISFRASHCYD